MAIMSSGRAAINPCIYVVSPAGRLRRGSFRERGCGLAELDETQLGLGGREAQEGEGGAEFCARRSTRSTTQHFDDHLGQLPGIDRLQQPAREGGLRQAGHLTLSEPADRDDRDGTRVLVHLLQ
jgi:hypothetical protein